MQRQPLQVRFNDRQCALAFGWEKRKTAPLHLGNVPKAKVLQLLQ